MSQEAARAMEKDVALRTQVIPAEGFDCSAEEVKGVSAELSEDELGRVVGGEGPLTGAVFTNATVGTNVAR